MKTQANHWTVEGRKGSWYITHPTKRDKRIGPVGGPKGDGRGRNFYDVAQRTAQERNRTEAL